MGVPAFFRWLSKKYASIVVHCTEEKNMVDGEALPVDASLPNPNDVEFDNLYLDMNGIIHPCCHPEDRPAPKDEDEMMVLIFEYIDRIFNIVRPRKLLYMAIDGVAPRAKMNQQRSRRFRASKESREKREAIRQTREELAARGVELPPEKPASAHFDSNCITPGTEFMHYLAKCLRFYVHDRMNNNIAWQNIKVILSDANVPGEGEHKIMDYIRRQRASPGHDPNTRHCLYGADADLIMLGLATHEPYFTILREEFKLIQRRPCEICDQYGHDMQDCTGAAREKKGEFDEFAVQDGSSDKEFIFIRLSVLREYLERELRMEGLTFPFDLERAIDDWVFMCFFVGNDFLPHLPSLEIREGAIDRLISLYKTVVPISGGYLTENGKVTLSRVQLILTELGKVEDEIFKRRRETELEFRRRQKEKRKRQRLADESRAPRWERSGFSAPRPVDGQGVARATSGMGLRQEAYQARMHSMSTQEEPNLANQAAAASLKGWLKRGSGGGDAVQRSMSAPSSSLSRWGGREGDGGMTRKRPLSAVEQDSDEDEEPEDDVKLWEDGWKERYYINKFGVPSGDVEFRRRVVEAYTQGLCWVFAYYYQGCPSWKWFYPFHYAPFASDFRNIGQLRNDFDPGTVPFRPLEQLMGVFPSASSDFLPLSWRDLMRQPDSVVIDFYPTDFKVDLNGKRFAWQGVALLPFVEESRLIKALEDVYPNLSASEIKRNSVGQNRLFVHNSHSSFQFLCSVYEDYDSASFATTINLVSINPKLTQGVSGTVEPDDAKENTPPGNAMPVPGPLPGITSLKNNHVVCVKYTEPEFPDGYIFRSTLLPNVAMPPRTLKPSDKVGYFRPQLGFAPSDQSRTYSTPPNVQRFINSSLSDPKSARQFPQGHNSQQLSWQPFDEPRSAPQRAWSMQAPPRPHLSYPTYSGGSAGRGGYGGQPSEDRHYSNAWAPYPPTPRPGGWQGHPPQSYQPNYGRQYNRRWN